MRFLRNSLVLLLFVSVFSCREKPPLYFDGFSRTAGGLYYKIVRIGDGDYRVNAWDDVYFTCCFRKQNDSVFFSSGHEYVYYDPADSLQKTLFLSHFPNLVKGDSAIYYVRTADLFANYFQTEVPSWCRNDSLIKVEVGIKELKKEIRISDTELKLIRDHIRDHKLKVEAELPNKIFVLERKEGEGKEIVSMGKLISVDYKGRFLNDSLFDDPAFPLQFTYGSPDQLLKGLNFVIKGMHKGEFIKIILPSYLAYGDSGNTNGTVAPFTPLLYEITITDIK
jgi:hypothetical protein